VKGVRRLGVRVGNWLTAEEGKKLLAAESADILCSRRNRALLSLLIGCGLRRAEVTTLRFEDFQLREGHWVIADLIGKGGHIRTTCDGPVHDYAQVAPQPYAIWNALPSGTISSEHQGAATRILADEKMGGYVTNELTFQNYMNQLNQGEKATSWNKLTPPEQEVLSGYIRAKASVLHTRRHYPAWANRTKRSWRLK
jgi:hypothetical protein